MQDAPSRVEFAVRVMGYVDLHAHFLPALDDGSPDLATSMAMLRGLAELGYERVTATPHQYAHRYLPQKAQIDTMFDLVRQTAAADGVALELSLAAENMWDDVFHGRWPDGSFPRYDGGKAFLFEVRPEELPLNFEKGLFQLQVKGYRPVMAHPERYAPFWNDPARLERIAEAGCALLVDLGALTGYHGRHQQKAGRRLVESGLAHAVATDAHNLHDVEVAREGIDWIRKKLGLDAVTRLCDENPRRLLAGQAPD
jgi:protein-tyrosine phosphatase